MAQVPPAKWPESAVEQGAVVADGDEVRLAGSDLPYEVDVAAIAEAAADPMVIIDAEITGLWANEAAEEVFGWERAAWIGRSVAPLVHPDDLPTALASVQTVDEKSVGTAVEIRVRDASGAYRWVEVRGRSALAIPAIRGIILTIRDLTDRRRWEVANGDPALFQTIVQQAPTITLLMDTAGRIRSASRALSRILGYDLERVQGRRLTDLAPADSRQDGADHVKRAARQPDRHRFEMRLTHATRSESVLFEVSTVNMSQDPVVGGIVASLHDITTLDRVRSGLEYLATHDPLTGLANRALLIEHLEAALHRARRSKRDVGLFFIDLDDFKAVNDRAGHQAGDRVLQQVAEALRGSVRAADLVARFGGDEFVVLAPDTTREGARQLAERIEAAIGDTPLMSTWPSNLGASIGFAVSLGGVDGADELLRNADHAMYAVKAIHRCRTEAS